MTILHGRVSCCTLLMGQSSKLLYIILALSIIITFQAHICNAQYCHHSVNYTKGSEFESNLNRVLNNLVRDTSQTGFNISEYGQSPNQVYGLLQCRGDLTAEECYSRSQQANTTLRQACGNATGGFIWFDDCFLRYENHSFFGQRDTVDTYYIWNGNSVSDADVFNTALGKLLTNLSTEAASRSKLYASGTITDSFSRKIYGMLQCSRDISRDDCTTCLSKTVNDFLASYAGRPGVRGGTANCMVRYEIYPFFNSTADTPPVEAPAPVNKPVDITPSRNSTQKNKSSNKLPLILGVTGSLLLVVFLCLLAIGRRMNSVKFSRPNEGIASNYFCWPVGWAGLGWALIIYTSRKLAAVHVIGFGFNLIYFTDRQIEEDTLISHDRQIVFTMEALIIATENFHENNKLGEGGFGAVYKGTTEDGKEIAVKKLSLRSLQGKKEFLNEVQLVANIQHRNLVNLLGCCAEGSERLLVYEYLPNNSLDKILFNPNERNQLDWQKRYNIIFGVARGLLYLHEDSQLRIVHRDIKASNILLDKGLNPKIADFGLARLFREDESHVSTRVAGTYGYMAPEYAMQGQLSAKADVYSFGVLLLELITGRKNTDYSLSPEMQMLLRWAWSLYKQGNIVQMIDPSIIERCDEGQVCRCIHVGLLCTQADPSLRPPMSKISLMLSSASVTLPNPTKPAFVNSDVSKTNESGSALSHASAATTSSVSAVSSQFLIVAPPSNADNSITDLSPR